MKKFFSALGLSLAAVFFSALSVHAAAPENGSLVKGKQPAVYYVYQGKRYVFPNAAVYHSWYSNFSDVKTISDADLASLTLGGNLTFKPGSWLVKIQTDPKVYLIVGPKLYWVKDEDTAKALFGDKWASNVQDISDALFTDYQLQTESIDVKNSFHPEQNDLEYESPADILGWEEGEGEDTTAYPVPPKSNKTETASTGYQAKTSLSVEEMETWFKGVNDGWDLLYRYSTTTGPDYNFLFMNYGKSSNGSFSHRSLVVYGQSNDLAFSFAEIPYAKGSIAYPYAASVPVWNGGDAAIQGLFTGKSSKELIDWYSVYGPKYGWSTPTMTEESQLGDESGSFSVTNNSSKATVYISWNDDSGLMGMTISGVNPEQSKEQGRDNKRVADVENTVKAFAAADGDGAVLAGCTSPGSRLNACWTIGGSGPYISTSTLYDPSGERNTTACSSPATGVCNYAIRNGNVPAKSPTINDFRIDFWLEKGAGGLEAGAHYATENGLW